MLMLYFSGNGNSKYIAKRFSDIMGAEYHSIEEKVDFTNLICTTDTIAFCYPIYGSLVPRIMREFVINYKIYFEKIIIFCTQNIFSGDGARVFTELLGDIEYKVMYAEHFNMPSNICNLFFYPVSKEARVKKYFLAADRKMSKVCGNIQNNIIKKRGFNIFSKYLGLIGQRIYFYKIEGKEKKDVRINSDCISCSLCVKICPMKNLEIKDNKVMQKGNCTLCYRCVNTCPQKAITVLSHGRVKKQYGR